MATRNRPQAPTDDVRTVMIRELQARLAVARTDRTQVADGTGWFASEADNIARRLGPLEAGDPLDVWSWQLPEPWKSRWRPPRRVTVHADGTITERHRGDA